MGASWLQRTERLLGGAALDRLAESRVAVFGLGGVGGHAVEALARSGIGALDLIDKDTVEESNLNRQLAALRSTLGKRKTEVLAERIREINPACSVTVHDLFYLPAAAGEIDLSLYDYIVDAVDTVTAKLFLAEHAAAAGVPLISCMGTGNRLDPSKLMITDIAKTHDDPLARDVRKNLRNRGITHLTVVWSSELPSEPARPSGLPSEPARPSGLPSEPVSASCRVSPASSAFVPAAAGLLLASHVVRELASKTAARGCTLKV